MKIEFFNCKQKDDADPVASFDSWTGPFPEFGDTVTVEKLVVEVQDRELTVDKNGVVTGLLCKVKILDENADDGD